MHQTLSLLARRARPPVLPLLLLAPLAAQEPAQTAPRITVGVGYAGGTFEHRTEGSDLDDRTGAGLFQLHGEVTTAGGFGGGLRLEAIGTDDDLFADSSAAGASPTEARAGSLFLHGTWAVAAPGFAMPIRLGLLIDDYRLTDQATDRELDYGSTGVYLEFAPTVTLFAGEDLRWSAFAAGGIGVAATAIDADQDSRDYTSHTTRYGLEIGTRVAFGRWDVSLSGIGRWQSMAESSDEGGFAIAGYDSEFLGVQLAFGATF